MALFGLFGPPDVYKLHTKRNVWGLIKALNYKTDFFASAQNTREFSRVEDLRRDAARALGQIGDARAVEPLVAALRDNDWPARHVAAWALGQIGDARAVEPLVAALRDKYRSVRQNAVWALGQIGGSKAELALAKAELALAKSVIKEALAKSVN